MSDKIIKIRKEEQMNRRTISNYFARQALNSLCQAMTRTMGSHMICSLNIMSDKGCLPPEGKGPVINYDRGDRSQMTFYRKYFRSLLDIAQKIFDAHCYR